MMVTTTTGFLALNFRYQEEEVRYFEHDTGTFEIHKQRERILLDGVSGNV